MPADIPAESLLRAADLEGRIRRHQRRGLISTLAVTVLLIVFNLGLVWFTAHEVTTMNTTLEATSSRLAQAKAALDAADQQRETALAELSRAQAQIGTLEDAKAELQAKANELASQVGALEEALRQSTAFKQHVHPLTWTRTKQLYSVSDKQARLLERILDHSAQGSKPLRFSLANDPAKGFTSPGFAQFVLQRLNLVNSRSFEDTIRKLPPQAGTPRSGDILLYDGGYALFYFEIPSQHDRFVIGMTPVGVIALDVDFGAKQAGIVRTSKLFGQ